MAMASAWILGNLKGINLKVLNVSESNSLTDFYILASATNPIQAKSMADEIVYQLKQHGLETRSKEGFNDSDWVLIDLGDIIVHIFLEASRSLYDLEGLWKGSENVSIPQDYYFAADEREASNNTDTDRDFY